MKSSRRLILLLLVSCQGALAQNMPSERNDRFASMPNWAGIWEGEAASELRTGATTKAFHEVAAQKDVIPVVAPRGALDPFEAFAISRAQLMREPPYNAEWAAKYDRLRRKIQAAPASVVKPGSIMACGWDFPEIMDNAFDTLFQILVTPEETLLLFADGQARHLYTDRAHPSPDDLWPSDLGNSVGHWDGDSLVVDTIARRAGPLVRIPFVLSPDLSAQAHFTERLRMVDADVIQDDLVIEDFERLAHPWTVTLRFHRVKNLDRLIPTDCTENNRFRVVNDKVTIAPR